jgi:hypothetical protein
MRMNRYDTKQSLPLRVLGWTWVKFILTPIICALPVIPVVLLLQNNSDSTGFRPLGYPAANLAQPRDDYYGRPTQVYSSNADNIPAELCVTFEFLGLNPSIPDVSLGVLVGVTGPGKKALTTLSEQGYKNVSVVVKSDSGLATSRYQ